MKSRNSFIKLKTSALPTRVKILNTFKSAPMMIARLLDNWN